VRVKKGKNGDLHFKGPKSSINFPIFIEKRKETLLCERIGGKILQVAR